MNNLNKNIWKKSMWMENENERRGIDMTNGNDIVLIH